MQPRARTTATVLAAVAILAVAMGASALPVLAQEQLTGIVVSSNSGMPLLIDGVESEKLPISVAPGTPVCTPGQRVYKSEGERFIFQGWSSGGSEPCITPTRAGTYRALYAHEVLLLIKSTAPGIQRSKRANLWRTHRPQRARGRARRRRNALSLPGLERRRNALRTEKHHRTGQADSPGGQVGARAPPAGRCAAKRRSEGHWLVRRGHQPGAAGAGHLAWR